ncbi:hypothetical protein ILT44_08990 [Microvirga sp. BT689]|jgi:hypothetical protein|uniref:hypothetical protein n=1 Tax=Microvirga arvi TaxID=2778731 RepID=UPI001950A688|nr:hypothetical protein [Microvirga arvi]MBM6580315.1 hypothetical protein [Microvirga arvi]
MEHKHLDQLRSVADVQPRPLTRQERLQRWIALLEIDPTRSLNSLGEIEYKPPAERALVREDNSPLTVAYEDPILRADGLASDRLGDAMRYFALSDGQAHYALCSCLSGRTMEASTCAQRLRNATGDVTWQSVVGAWALAALAVSLPGLVYLLS